MRVIGTAGHVDHGKSALVEALTGMHPDRLKEEREREMTIELGFAWMTLGNQGGDQETVGIVDVPGHRDFIENMLAGVGGMDAVLFVVACDEGVMPQTREHLAIIDLLGVQSGIIVLTKLDLTPDEEWLALIENDVRQAVQGTVLADAPLLRVSARKGIGINALKSQLAKTLADCPIRPDLGRPRLPIDRVFTMPGFGTVVTGTLLDGSFSLGEDVEILPSGLRGRIRGLQIHKNKQLIAPPGARVAVNISGVEVDQIARGDVLAYPGVYQPTRRVDLFFRLLPGATDSLKHSSEVKFFTGSSEILSRVRILGAEEIAPGHEGWIQLELRDPVVAVRGDRTILRRPSPGETLGGGVVVDPHPTERHRRFDEAVLAQLEALHRGTPAEVLLQALSVSAPCPIPEAVTRARLLPLQAEVALSELLETHQLVVLESGEVSPLADTLVWTQPLWSDLTRKMTQELENYHHSAPLKAGMAREALKSRLKVTSNRTFQAAMRKWLTEDLITETSNMVRRSGFAIRLSAQQQTLADRLLKKFEQSPFSPPSIKEAQAEVGEDVYMALVSLGTLISVSAEVAFRRPDYDQMVAWVQAHFRQENTLTVIQFRDQMNTSRKYALAFLEYMDSIGLTQREGDFRRLKGDRK